jgi:catechol 2,3-dioxygenase-like lactoylglutathione lyase family enzyme
MRIELQAIDHVQVCIPPGAEADARAFYGGLLGFDEVPKPASLLKNGGMWYRSGKVELHIGLDPVRERTKGHPAFEVKGLRAIRAYLEGHHVPLKEEPLIPGRERFSFLDPWGNRIELLEYLEPPK